MKKFLGNNGYFIPLLIIVFSIALAVLIHWIVESYYPAWVFDTLMKRVPGYVLVNEKLDKSNFGDMYGPLNALFSGIGIIGLIATIFIQIYLYRHDKNTNKREKKKEEKQLLYYIWFRLDSMLTDIRLAIEESEKIVTKYKNREDLGKIAISSQFSDEAFRKRYLEHLNAINIEKNHLVYLKYLKNRGLIQLFDFIPDCVERIATLTPELNKIFFDDKTVINDYFSHPREFIIYIHKSIKQFLETDDYHPEAVKSIKLCLDLHIYSIINEKITFAKLQEVVDECLSYAENESEEALPIFLKELHELRKFMYYTNYDFYYEKINELDGIIGYLNSLNIQISSILVQIKKHSKVPEPVPEPVPELV